MTEQSVLWATGAMSVVAIIAAPMITLSVQARVERRDALKKRREGIFKALWLNRRRPFHVARIDALNMIDVEFYGEKQVRYAWDDLRADYFDQNAPKQDDKTLAARRSEKFTALLYEISQVLGYEFGRQHIRDNVYLPQLHADVTDMEIETRKRVVDLLRSDALPVRFVEGPPAAPVAKPAASNPSGDGSVG
jgi:hypothetical protein